MRCPVPVDMQSDAGREDVLLKAAMEIFDKHVRRGAGAVRLRPDIGTISFGPLWT